GTAPRQGAGAVRGPARAVRRRRPQLPPRAANRRRGGPAATEEGAEQMMNFIGKGLVLFHTLLSLAGMTLAIVIWFEYVDWGRAEPRALPADTSKGGKEQRVASEFD